VGNLAIVVLALVMLAAGAGGGWVARGYVDGAVVSASAAATDSQSAVDVGIEADRTITAARTETETAVERVRYVTRTVEVATSCPPGRGPVSADLADQLRAVARARSDAGAGVGRVP
jgi:hypothetical protein